MIERTRFTESVKNYFRFVIFFFDEAGGRRAIAARRVAIDLALQSQ